MSFSKDKKTRILKVGGTLKILTFHLGSWTGCAGRGNTEFLDGAPTHFPPGERRVRSGASAFAAGVRGCGSFIFFFQDIPPSYLLSAVCAYGED